MKQLSGAVHDLASEVVSALAGGGHSGAVGAAGPVATAGFSANDALRVAAVRTLGADVLLPSRLLRRPAAEPDVLLVREAVRAYPPGPDASPATVWSHWALEDALLRAEAAATAADTPQAPSPETGVSWYDDRPPGAGAGSRRPQPDASALAGCDWPRLTHQLAVLGALAVPGASSRVAAEAARRPVDLARGFVRAVRRRDWLQAAGAGRWLALLPDVPASLGLDGGLEFVLLMGGGDARVALHAHAAQLMRAAAVPAAPSEAVA